MCKLMPLWYPGSSPLNGLGACSLILLLGGGLSQSGSQPASDTIIISAVFTDRPPLIDGQLVDACWQKASTINEFWRTDREERFPFQTTVYLCYDSRQLYVGFDCSDPEPSLVRAQQTKRGGLLEYDDYVGVVIDAAGQQSITEREYFEFFVNPIGTQSEYLPGGAAFKAEWRGQWRAAARVTPTGWAVEMAIPFSMLRLPRNASQIRVALIRHVPPPRSVKGSFPYRLGQSLNNMASFKPLQLAMPHPPIQMMPRVTLASDSNGTELQTGIELKQTLTSGLTWNVSLKPDFRVVEDVVETIDFTYVPRVLPDRRPFFTEGAAFLPDTALFYSRRVGQLDGGGKVFGKVGRHSLGILAGRDAQGDWIEALHWGYELNPYTRLHVQFADWVGRQGEPAWRLGYEYQRPAADQWLRQLGIEIGGAGGDYARLNWGLQPLVWDGRVGWGIMYERIGTYQPAIGFVPERNYSALSGVLVSAYKGDTSSPTMMRAFRLDLSYRSHYRTDRSGDLLDQALSFAFHQSWRSGQTLTLRLDQLHRPPYSDLWVTTIWEWDAFDLRRRGRLTVASGRRANGIYSFINLSQSVVLGKNSTLNMSYQQLYHPVGVGRSSQLIVSGVHELDRERSVVWRWVAGRRPKAGTSAQESVNNFYVGYRQVVMRGVDLYFLVGDPNAARTRSQLLIQMMWAL
jgi:hypothetical protein